MPVESEGLALDPKHKKCHVMVVTGILGGGVDPNNIPFVHTFSKTKPLSQVSLFGGSNFFHRRGTQQVKARPHDGLAFQRETNRIPL